MKRQSGFTLVEVLVVVAVIGMLASMAIPVFKGAMNKAKRNSAIAGLRVMHDAMDQYHADVGSYPSYFAFDSRSLSPVVPSQLKNVAPVLKRLRGQRFDFYLPWDVFGGTLITMATLQRPTDYTLFATLAHDPDGYIVMTDKDTFLWDGNAYMSVGKL